jgi:thiol-disulfide isomerase/thioredoxin
MGGGQALRLSPLVLARRLTGKCLSVVAAAVVAVGSLYMASAANAATGDQPGFEAVPWSAAMPAPRWQGTDLEGRVWQLSKLSGRAVLINFWASWCEPCRAEMPSLQQIAVEAPDKLIVLAVNLKESEDTVRRFAQRTDLQLPLILDADGGMARAWGVTVYPSTVLIDTQGRVHSVVRGEVDWQSAAAHRLIAPLLK